MFNRYWRTYPWFLQLFLFVVMMFTLMSFGTYLVLALIPRITGVPIDALQHLGPSTTARVARAALLFQGIAHACTFAIPALLFAYFTHPRPAELLGLRRPGRPVHWALVTGIMLGLLPVFLFAANWLEQHVRFGNWADRLQKETDDTFRAFLQLRSPGDFFWVFISLAILPAFGEELLFRGILMRFAHKRIRPMGPQIRIAGETVTPVRPRGMAFPILITALLFSAMHPNPYGFIFILIAGVVLAMIYWLTGSLWCSIWAHLLFNGSQVAGIYAAGNDTATKAVVEGGNIPFYLPLAGLILFGISFYGLLKTRTPLPPDWSEDYRPDEVPE